MKPSEADKIIAEFMGHLMVNYDGDLHFSFGGGFHSKAYYSQSLDALVPVWEKLDVKGIDFLFNNRANVDIRFKVGKKGVFDLCKEVTADSKTIQQAAAIATAKAIKELGE